MSVQNSFWGPPLWRTLHTLAEKLGRQTTPMIEADENRYWIQLLKSVSGAMPCALCRNHYEAWRKSNPLELFQPLRRVALRDAARKWLWSLHETVNKDRGVTGPMLEQMEEMYARRTASDVKKDLDLITTMSKQAMIQRLITGEQYRTFREKMGLLQRTVGFYSS